MHLFAKQLKFGGVGFHTDMDDDANGLSNVYIITTIEHKSRLANDPSDGILHVPRVPSEISTSTGRGASCSLFSRIKLSRDGITTPRTLNFDASRDDFHTIRQAAPLTVVKRRSTCSERRWG